MNKYFIRTIVFSIIAMINCVNASSQNHPAVVLQEFVYTEAPFPSCHASTLAEVQPGVILAAWFGGTGEGNKDVGIWTARREGDSWTRPVEAASAAGVPCWNPVLFKMPDGETILFYKAGPSPREWSGLLKRSADGGKTWSEEEILPAGILGPIKNKPLLLDDGTLVCGSSVESWRAWSCWMELTRDAGKTWNKFGPIEVPGVRRGLIQPTLFQDRQGNLRILCRSTRQIGSICSAVSRDGGKTWSPAAPIELPNPNAGIDAVGLQDGRIVLVYNHTKSSRRNLSVAVSGDGGDSWKTVLALENQERGEYSYPAVIQTGDGMVHTTYTWRRERIKHVVLDPSKF